MCPGYDDMHTFSQVSKRSSPPVSRSPRTCGQRKEAQHTHPKLDRCGRQFYSNVARHGPSHQYSAGNTDKPWRTGRGQERKHLQLTRSKLIVCIVWLILYIVYVRLLRCTYHGLYCTYTYLDEDVVLGDPSCRHVLVSFGRGISLHADRAVNQTGRDRARGGLKGHLRER